MREENYDNVVVVCPSKEYIASLPNNKIPDRTDFTDFDAPIRIKNWQTVLTQGDRLAEAFDDFIEKQSLNQMKPIQSLIYQ